MFTDRRHRDRRHRAGRLLAMCAAATLALAACGDDFESADSAGSDTAATAEPSVSTGGESVDGGGATEPADAIAGGSDVDEMLDEGEADRSDDLTSAVTAGQSGAALPAPPELAAIFAGADIIFDATVAMEVDDVVQATADAVEAVQGAGGAVWGQDTAVGDVPRSVLTIRVAPANFNAVLVALDGVGTVTSQTMTSDDVTERVIDLESRITAAESSAARVRELLDNASDLNTIFSLEEELATREAALETLRGQLKTLADRVALSTITLTITQANPLALDAEMEVVAWLGTGTDDACPGTSDLSIGADDTATLCVEISNTGDDVLTELTVASPTFRLRVDDFSVVGEGSVDALPAGEELLLAVDLDAEDGFVRRTDVSDGMSIEVTVVAVPQRSPDAELAGTDAVFLSADVPDPLPGFSDSFRSGWEAMIGVVSVLMIGLGLILPFLPFLVVFGWLARRAWRASEDRAEERRRLVEAYHGAAGG